MVVLTFALSGAEAVVETTGASVVMFGVTVVLGVDMVIGAAVLLELAEPAIALLASRRIVNTFILRPQGEKN